MTDTHETVGAIRRACYAIADHWEGSLSGPRVGGGIGPLAGSREAPLPVSVAVLDDRRDAHHDLAHWGRVVYDLVRNGEGGQIQQRITTDEDAQPVALAQFIAHWADGLARADIGEAELCAEELGEHGRKLKNHALPDRKDWIALGDCPVTVADEQGNSVPCGARLKAYPDNDEVHRFVTCPGCGTEDTIQWWMSQILPEASEIAPVTTVIAAVAARTHRVLTSNLIRQWKHQGWIQGHGKDLKGRTLYSVAAVLAYSERGQKEEAA